MTDTATPQPGSSTPIVTPDAAAQAAASAAAATQAAAAKAAQDAAAAAVQKPEEKTTPDPLTLETEKDDKGKSTFVETGHAGLDMSLAFLGKHGFGPGHPGMAAAVNGDFSILKAQIAEKGIAGGEAYIALAEKAYTELHEKHEAGRAKDKADLHAIVGGEEQWKAVSEWGKANAGEEQGKALNEMLGMGGEHMKIAAAFLANSYLKATGGVAETDGAGPRVADTSGAASFTTDTLSPSEYGREVAKARMAHKPSMGDFEKSAAYTKLVDRRTRFKG